MNDRPLLALALVTTMEGSETREDLEAGLDRVRELGPAFRALRKCSAEFEISAAHDTSSAAAQALSARMRTAMTGLLGKFPQEVSNLSEASSQAMVGQDAR